MAARDRRNVRMDFVALVGLLLFVMLLPALKR